MNLKPSAQHADKEDKIFPSLRELGGNSDQPLPFKVFGLQRTCTNLMVHLLTHNFHVVPTELGGQWKHGFAKRYPWSYEGRQVRLVVCVKHPLAWLDSFYRWCTENVTESGSCLDPGLRKSRFVPKVSFADFLRMPCYAQESPMDRWNVLNRHWLQLTTDRRALQVIRSEDLCDPAGQRRVLRRIENELQLVRQRDHLKIERRRVRVKHQPSREFMDGDYYLKHKYLQAYTPLQLNWAHRRADQQLLRRLGYQWPDLGEASMAPEHPGHE